MKTEVEKYLKDAKGNNSSTRYFSYLLLKFFMWFNALALPLLGIFAFVLKGEVNAITMMLGISSVWLVFNALLGIMIFAPKQMGKVEEIKELIALATGNKTENK